MAEGFHEMPAVNARRGFVSLKHHLLQDHPDPHPRGDSLLGIFKYKMDQYDQIRGENFAETFPEMKDLVSG
jgi:hypothetical protein